METAEGLALQSDVAGAWKVLELAGDTYAAGAYQIINEYGDPQSAFARIVEAQWTLHANAVNPDALDTLFLSVGQQHLNQYLALIRQHEEADLYRLPNTKQIEASYRAAVENRICQL